MALFSSLPGADASALRGADATDRSAAATGIDFCATCALADVCALAGYGRPELSGLHYLVEHLDPIPAGEPLFRKGDPFDALFAVRSGAIKATIEDAKGRERVLGFFLPGEAVGLYGIYADRYPCNAIALEKTMVCRFSFHAMSELAARRPNVQEHVFRMLSKELGTANLQASCHSVAQCVAAFLLNMSERYAARGFSSTRFRLSMAHTDIASYLCVAAETISRALRRFREQGLVALDGHEVELLDPRRLRELAGVL